MSLTKTEARQRFLEFVADYVRSDPEAAAHVANYVQEGLRDALAETHERAVDMETVIFHLATPKQKNTDSLVLEKLVKWRTRSSCKWDWLIDRLEKKVSGGT